MTRRGARRWPGSADCTVPGTPPLSAPARGDERSERHQEDAGRQQDDHGGSWAARVGKRSTPVRASIPSGREAASRGPSAWLGWSSRRALKEQVGPPRRPLEAVPLREEEGSRFRRRTSGAPARSPVASGPRMPRRCGVSRARPSPTRCGRSGWDPRRLLEAVRDDLDTFVELHVERGPVLERDRLPVAVVGAITGIRHPVVALGGVAYDDGAFPMGRRRDPMAGAAEIVSEVIDAAHRPGRPAVTTVGRVIVEPNAPAIVPERATSTVDARRPDPAGRAVPAAGHGAVIGEVVDRRDLEITRDRRARGRPCDLGRPSASSKTPPPDEAFRSGRCRAARPAPPGRPRRRARWRSSSFGARTGAAPLPPGVLGAQSRPRRHRGAGGGVAPARVLTATWRRRGDRERRGGPRGGASVRSQVLAR